MLSVVIPSYNHEKYIIECLSSASKIPVKELEIIVIDDGSTDSSVEKVKLFIKDNGSQNIRLIQKQNSGLVSSLNMGLELVATEYMYIVASDDIPVPDGIQSCVLKMNANKAIDFCIGGGLNIDAGGEVLSSVYSEKHEQFFSREVGEADLFFSYPSPVLLQSTVFKASVLREIGGWDPSLRLDDYPMFIKLLNTRLHGQGHYMFCPEIPVVKYRHHGENTYSKIENQFFMVKQTIDKLAPSSLKYRAISRVAAFYLLTAVRRKKYATAANILRSCGLRCSLRVPIYMAGLIYARLFSK